MLCKHCKSLMRKVLHFCNDGVFSFKKCPNCNTVTPKRNYTFAKEIKQKNTTYKDKSNIKYKGTEK